MISYFDPIRGQLTFKTDDVDFGGNDVGAGPAESGSGKNPEAHEALMRAGFTFKKRDDSYGADTYSHPDGREAIAKDPGDWTVYTVAGYTSSGSDTTSLKHHLEDFGFNNSQDGL